MADSKAALTPSVPAPSYDDAAVQHGALPSRPNPSGKPPPRGPLPLEIPILQFLKGKRVILASASPRRKHLLATIGLNNLEILPSTKPENLSKKELSPFEYVLKTATQKCLDVYTTAISNSLASIPDPALIIAADTVVITHSGLILEKPKSEADHIAMLKMLRDQGSHKVVTAVAVLAPREDARAPGYNMETAVEETRVVFDEKASDELLLSYVRTREGVDKAGGYGIQGVGGLLVSRIEGSWDNVVGLPVRITVGVMERVVFNQGDGENSEEEEE